MNCNEFKAWLGSKDLYDEHVSGEADSHLFSCEQCRKLSEFDDLIESNIRKGMQKSDVPTGLLNRIEADIILSTKENSSRFVLWNKFVPVLAAAALVLILIVNPFSSQIQTLDQMGTYVLENHLAVDSKMAFEAAAVSNVAAWFRERLGYSVKIPDLSSLGLTLLGGKKCALGKNAAAYLVCDREGKRVSLFIINADAINFNMADARSYGVYDQGSSIKVWKADQMVYAIVEDQAMKL